MRPIIVMAAATVSALVAAAGVFGAAAAFTGPPTARVAKAADGHFRAQARIGGHDLDVLVDTGATSMALTAADARALGLPVERLRYDRPIVTAAGPTRAASVTLQDVAVGDVHVAGVPALVVREGLSGSLLGMSYLGRLSGFQADREGLVLRR